MAKRTARPKRYDLNGKFELVLESLRGERSDTEIARAHGVHPVTFSNWKRQFLDNGATLFGGNDESKQYERRIAELEPVLGQKEVELALLKVFLGIMNTHNR